METKSQNANVPSSDVVTAKTKPMVSRSELKTMEWQKIRRIKSTVHELAYLIPEDSASRAAVLSETLTWQEILAAVDQELNHEEELWEIESLFWERLNDLRGQILALIEVLKFPGLPTPAWTAIENVPSLS